MADTYNVTYDIQNLPMGIDTAGDANGPINITKEGAPVPEFGAAKCGEGYWRDTEYLKTRAQYDKLGKPFIAYYVLRHSVPIAIQVKMFLNWAGSDCLYYSPDLEKTRDSEQVSKSIVSANTRDFIHGLMDAGKNVMPYTTSGWVNEKFRSPVTYLLPDWVTKEVKSWWLAAYQFIGERSSLPIPTGIDKNKVEVFQTWNKAPNKYGSIYDSWYVDRDRWVGKFPGSVTPPIQTEDPVIPSVKLGTVVSPTGVNVRTSPSTNSSKVGALPYNSNMIYTAIAKDTEGNTWLKIDTGWVCSVYRGTTLIKI